jgi:hypothetical protein
MTSQSKRGYDTQGKLVFAGNWQFLRIENRFEIQAIKPQAGKKWS